MKKKYLLFLLVCGVCYACSSDSPEVPAPKPDPEEEQPKDPEPDQQPDPKPEPGQGTAYTFPKDFTDELIGKEVAIANELVVVRTYGDKLEGKLTLAPAILRIPTDVELPGTEAYHALALANRDAQLTLSATGITLLDPRYKTLRVGTKFTALKGKVSKERNRYVLTLTATPTIQHAERPTFASVSQATASADVMIASMNLEYYMASPSNWGHSNGASNEGAFDRQNQKIVAALKEIKADIFALSEMEEGSYSPAYLTEQLNQALQTKAYKYVDTGDKKVSSYTKNTFIYNSEVVNPFKDCKSYESDYLPLRHLFQCFEKNGSGEKFILSLNHFKSKSGKASGKYEDKHDGQGAHNARRVEEATHCLRTVANLQTYYGDQDVMVVGDLNSYSKEDPIRKFTDAGYVDELMKHAPEAWSYVYDGQVGYLDHILSSASMSSQVVKAMAWDVNASEPSGVGYQLIDYFQSDAYRYSDHNPVVVFLDLK